ncbi:Core-2/I-branching beta-1-6-N-acetylglucosaminyltransferase family protein [Striga hermonthica]|uniref:Core-2/I-branching beta-1-6-N-acetylglucosaminyltransferase family protein n=1 Tax=Striga hermonthica TaxID=68872 RepID=A0A9N7MWL5_STRHE|nr:Core-2/I-branching beta-1-6-N-acetylglucosaminyltransferase family protein [Striga hermonthica]
MRKNLNLYSGRIFTDRRWKIPCFVSLLVSITIVTATICGLHVSPYARDPPQFDNATFVRQNNSGAYFVETDLRKSLKSVEASELEPPRLAYLISGTKGDSRRMMRTLQAVYHPRNRYILHMDLEAPPRERLNLTMWVKNDPTFNEVGNVRVMAHSNLVTYKGPTMIACTLQAMAILLRESSSWDWFINLSASDYPLVTQDDLLFVLSNVSRNINFIEHGHLDWWKLNHRAKPIIIDPGLYLSRKSDLFWTTQRRTEPTAFKLFTGSAWVVLTRSFVEYCIWGWDSLPRTALMYYTNYVSSPEGYFHTVICNTPNFRPTAVNHDLHYIAWDNPPKQHPRSLSVKDFGHMVNSSSAFARKFHADDLVLDRIDRELLGRPAGGFSPGAWCVGSEADPCGSIGDDSDFRPGPGARRLAGLVKRLLSEDHRRNRCPGL